jgi:CheY-like chemotaxis protein
MASMADRAEKGNTSVVGTPVILGLVSDLFFASKIDAAAKTIDFQVLWYELEKHTTGQGTRMVASQLAEQVTGPGFELLERITVLQPVLIIFDLSDSSFPWQEWLPLVKSAPATRRIPTIAFGSHVDSEKLKIARSAGADLVLARSAFAREMPQILQRMARKADVAGITSACTESLSPLGVRGLEEFNRGEYFQAHESLEEAWNQDRDPGRELYRAILQVAVAYLQIERNNYHGAMKMILRMRQWMDPLPEICRGVDIAALRSNVALVHDELIRIGIEGIQDFDHSLIKPVVFKK